MSEKNPNDIAFNAIADLFKKLKQENAIGVEIEQGKIVPDLSEQDIDREMVFKQMKKIEELKSELSQLQDKLDLYQKRYIEAEKIVEFYGDKDNYSPMSMQAKLENEHLGICNDSEIFYKSKCKSETVGGKRARAYLEKYKGRE